MVVDVDKWSLTQAFSYLLFPNADARGCCTIHRNVVSQNNFSSAVASDVNLILKEKRKKYIRLTLITNNTDVEENV